MNDSDFEFLDNDTVVLEFNYFSSNNDDDSANTKPFHLIPPDEDDFTCNNMLLDDSSDSSITMPCENLGLNSHNSRQPPEPLPSVMPEITFDTAALVLNTLRNNPSSFLPTFSPLCMACPNSLPIAIPHTCDYAMEANASLSSTVTYDDIDELLFPRKEPTLNCSFSLSKSHDALLTTLQSLDTISIANTLNSNKSARKLKCHNTIMLLQAHQMKGGGGLTNLSLIR